MTTGKPLILVVDDETHILHVVSLKLTNAGYDVVTAEDGEEGLELATTHQPDLIITDLQMPLMTGLEMCEKLKDREPTADTPVIMLTARGASISQQQLGRTSIASVIGKPFSPREILLRVQELLNQPQTVEQADD